MKNISRYLILIVCIFSYTIHLKAQTYDMRSDLTPSRLTIAMWDYSWLNQHYTGGFFEDYNKVTDELIERGFNTVRIDAFPLVIGKMETMEQVVTIEGDPLRNWGASDKDRKHAVVTELVEFMKMTKKKNISVILSSWGTGAIEFPEIRKDFENPREHWQAWEKVLDILKENDLLSHVVYIDFDQEFPYFSPVAPELNRLGQEKNIETTSALQAMEAAGSVESNFKKLKWNSAQMTFVRSYFNSTLTHFQHKYPELRFTFSLTSYWKEVRAMNLKTFDVLELHFWMTQSERFNSRSGFGGLTKDRGQHDYKDYMNRLEKTMNSVRPMLMKDMHNRLAWAKEWSEEIGAPLTTTEAWGPWWHMDHKDLNWEWLYDWCEGGMQLSAEYKLWGTTPWNYSHPYWNNWTNVAWYTKVNNGFLDN
ncbi:MAG: hypothetical protein HQ522_21560 [Bacteroidetes bacterium]|nr:hypothetical protein [Bacteroidota bacterium]